VRSEDDLKSQTLLVILAHPDDESFPIGGTLAKAAAQAARVVLVCATKGEASISGLTPEATAAIRERELRAEQPQVVVTFGPDGISGHPDHLAIHRLTTAAFDRAALPDARLYYIAPSEATQLGCGVVPTPSQAGGPVAAIDVGEHLTAKARAMRSHASQHPPYAGPPEEAAARLPCREYFTLARPCLAAGSFTDLFAARQA
jgi:LmbE family N-acetylglucosaminyl deacetylase